MEQTSQALRGEIAALKEDKHKLCVALEQCSDWFTEYGEMHKAKGNQEKMVTNLERANYALTAIIDHG